MPPLYTIYSTLGSKTDAYDDTQGAYVTGPDSNYGQCWTALPFTPKSNAEVTEIEVPVGYYQGGTNGVAISLNEDKNGLPGKPLHTWNLKNLPTFGTCCKLDVVKDVTGLKVKKGTQYWIVASTNKSTESTEAVWAETWNDSKGAYAFNTSGYWWPVNQIIPALGVFGKKTK